MLIDALIGPILLAIFLFLLWENRRLAGLNISLRRRERDLTQHLETDPLTGLHNRLTIERLRDSGTPVSGIVVVLDLDDMKRVNDELGHLAGDELLVEVGHLIQGSIRREDIACRWGGDEFVILFQDQSMRTVRERMNHIQSKLSRFRLRSFGCFPLRASWGAAQAQDSPLCDSLSLADQCMYEMKRARKPSAKSHPSQVCQ